MGRSAFVMRRPVPVRTDLGAVLVCLRCLVLAVAATALPMRGGGSASTEVWQRVQEKDGLFSPVGPARRRKFLFRTESFAQTISNSTSTFFVKAPGSVLNPGRARERSVCLSVSLSLCLSLSVSRARQGALLAAGGEDVRRLSVGAAKLTPVARCAGNWPLMLRSIATGAPERTVRLVPMNKDVDQEGNHAPHRHSHLIHAQIRWQCWRRRVLLRASGLLSSQIQADSVPRSRPFGHD
jgi:hypothetical protein